MLFFCLGFFVAPFVFVAVPITSVAMPAISASLFGIFGFGSMVAAMSRCHFCAALAATIPLCAVVAVRAVGVVFWHLA